MKKILNFTVNATSDAEMEQKCESLNQALAWINVSRDCEKFLAVNPNLVCEIAPGGAQLCTRKQAAQMVQLAPRTLERWAKTDPLRLPVVRVGHTVRYRLDDIYRYVQARSAAAREHRWANRSRRRRDSLGALEGAE